MLPLQFVNKRRDEFRNRTASFHCKPDVEMELPYEGAKEMLLVENIENREFLRELLDAMYPELPESKKRKK